MFYDDSMWEAFKLLHYYSSKLLDDMLYDHEVNGSNIQERLQTQSKRHFQLPYIAVHVLGLQQLRNFQGN